MIPRLVKETREAMAKPEPLSSVDMARLAFLMQNKEVESESDHDERIQLQIKQDRFLDEIHLPTDEPDSKEEIERKIKNRQQTQQKVRGVLRYFWVVGLVLLVAGMVYAEYRPFFLWLSMLALRVQIAENLFFEGGFSTQKILSIIAVEIAYPLYRLMATPQLAFNHALVYGTLAFAVLFWVAVFFITLDAYRPSISSQTSVGKKTKKNNRASVNKKRKRS